MQDAIMKGTGNSRYLKSVSGFLTLYPTYETFVDALVSGTLPVDFNGINPDGWAQEGTPLDKASLLTDSTAGLAGLSEEDTPNDMFAALFHKANGAKTTADSALSKANSAASTASSALSKANSALSKAGGLITYGTSDLTDGVSPLTTGTIYAVYE